MTIATALRAALAALAVTLVPRPATGALGDCSQPVTGGAGPAASDCLFILRSAVGSTACEPACTCSPRGAAAISASDSLLCLKAAVGQPVTLQCPCALVRVHYRDESGLDITLRGSGGGLSEQADTPCTQSRPDLWLCNLGSTDDEVVFEPWRNGLADSRGARYVLSAPGTLDIFPFFVESQGTVTILQDFSSTILGDTRDVAVYLPPSYEENTVKSYPVLFLQDGADVFDAATAFGGTEWMADETLDALATTGAIREFIVVAPYAGAGRIHEYTPTEDADLGSGGDADLYVDFLLQELLPHVQETYRIDSATAPAIAGSSLGGLLALHAAWNHRPQFSAVAALSPSLWWDDGWLVNDILNDGQGYLPMRIYVDVGTGEPQESQTLASDLAGVLLEKGWTAGEDILHVIAQGHGHNVESWALRLPTALAFLLRDPDRAAP